MTSSLEAFASVDFGSTRVPSDVWGDSPFHVASLNGDHEDRIAAEFFARTRAARSLPAGLALQGARGTGKTHLLGALRARVVDGGGVFVLFDAAEARDFWPALARAFVDSLSRRGASAQGRPTQAGGAVKRAFQAIASDPAALEAAKAQPIRADANALDLLVVMLTAGAPEETRGRQDILRALALFDSRDPDVGDFARRWLSGGEAETAPDLGFAGPPPAREIVEGLMRILSLGGPTLIAIDRIEGLDEAQTRAFAQGLVELHGLQRRAMTLLACSEAAWERLADAAAPLRAAFRPLSPLAPPALALTLERLIAARLAGAYGEAGFAPPYPTYPFPPAAIAQAIGVSPRALLERCRAHQRDCLAAGAIRECAALAREEAPAQTVGAKRPSLPPPIAPPPEAEPPSEPAAAPRAKFPPPIVPAPAPPVVVAAAAATPSVAALPALATREPPARGEIYLGRSQQVGEVVGPVSLPRAQLSRHVAVLAPPSLGRGALVSRIVEEAALLGAPALVIDANNEFLRLGEPWPSRPTDFSEDDARKAKVYFERVETCVWTPGQGGARDIALPMFPDFAALGRGGDPESQEERDRAIELSLSALEPFLPRASGPRAILLRGALADALRAFVRAGGGGLDDLQRLLGDLPSTASRIPEAAALAREIAIELAAAMALDPRLAFEGGGFDLAQLFASPSSRKTRVSVVSLRGLPDATARLDFLNRLQTALFSWIKRHPAPTGRLYVLNEAQLFAAAKESSPAKRSALALVQQARKCDLGVVVAASEPRALDRALIAHCAAHVYGRFDAPADAELAAALMASRGGAGEEIARLKSGEFCFSGEATARPIKIRAALSLSRRSPNPPLYEEAAGEARRWA